MNIHSILAFCASTDVPLVLCSLWSFLFNSSQTKQCNITALPADTTVPVIQSINSKCQVLVCVVLYTCHTDRKPMQTRQCMSVYEVAITLAFYVKTCILTCPLPFLISIYVNKNSYQGHLWELWKVTNWSQIRQGSLRGTGSKWKHIVTVSQNKFLKV